MTGKGTDETVDCLSLRSQLSEVKHLSPWLESLASRHSIPGSLLFAMRLCLEEVLSNVILHGYREAPDRPITIRFSSPQKGCYVFEVEDEAPPFNPLKAPELPPVQPNGDLRVGGHGIRLMRQFAEALEYESTATGNRLKMRFSAAAPPSRAT